MNEPFWDELGIAWQATPAPEASLERMKAHFRRTSRQIRLAIWFAGIGGTFLAALGAFTMWQGSRLGALNFEIRGVAVLIVAVILWVMVGMLWPVRDGDARSLSEFAELGLTRARRSRRSIVMALAACAVVLLGGCVVGGTEPSRMPVTSPWPPTKTMSEQEKKFSLLSDRTHWMNISAAPERPAGSAWSQ